jgi:site-specific recombinase XerD
MSRPSAQPDGPGPAAEDADEAGAGAAEADTAKVLEACRGKGFVILRDEALIRLYANTGARLSEVGNLHMADVDLNTESVHFRGKGAKDRRVRFGRRRLGR